MKQIIIPIEIRITDHDHVWHHEVISRHSGRILVSVSVPREKQLEGRYFLESCLPAAFEAEINAVVIEMGKKFGEPR